MNRPPKPSNIDEMQFISYYHQIELPTKIGAKKILEIGIGDKTTSNYLKQHNFEIITCDIDKNRTPNIVADIRNLPFKNNSFDTIITFEVLEHLPWDYINQIIEDLHRITGKFVIISVPYSSHHFELVIKFPFIRKILKKDFIDIFFRIPFPVRDIKSIDEPHYWEIGRKSYSLKKLKKVLLRKFKIIIETRPLLHSYHYFFVLEKMKSK